MADKKSQGPCAVCSKLLTVGVDPLAMISYGDDGQISMIMVCDEHKKDANPIIKGTPTCCTCHTPIDDMINDAVWTGCDWVNLNCQVTRLYCSNKCAMVYHDVISSTMPELGVRPACMTCREFTIPLKICAGCRLVSYCSIKCQKEDWKRHKPECGD